MRRKILVICLALVMVIPFVSCTNVPSVQDIMDGMEGVAEDVTSVSCDMDVDLDILYSTDSEDVTMISAEAALSTTADTANRQMQMEADVDLSISDPASSSMEGYVSMGMGLAFYLVDDVAYIMMDDPLEGVSWGKYEIPAEAIQQIEEMMGEGMNLARLQTGLLEVSEVVVEASDSINGVDCYRLKLTLDADKIWQKLEQQAQEMGEEIPEDVDLDMLEKIIQGVSITQWVAKDTYYTAKIEVMLDMEIDSGDFESATEEGAISINGSFTLELYDYNQPVSIELPPEAEEAEDIMDGLMPTFMP